MGTAARALKPDIGLIGVQPELYPSMYAKLGGHEMESGGDTLAEGIAVKQPGAFTSKVLDGLVDEIVLVSEQALEQALALLLQIEKTVVEGRRRGRARGGARASGEVQGPQCRAGADRRQYRHPPAGERAAARSCALGPPRAPQDSSCRTVRARSTR